MPSRGRDQPGLGKALGVVGGLPARLLRLPLFAGVLHRRALRTIEASGLFDRAWYLARYPDVARKNVDPLLHFLSFGARERRDPGPAFDTAWYLRCAPDVERAGVNPLLHYLLRGRAEGRIALGPARNEPAPAGASEAIDAGSFRTVRKAPRLLAWYLPQYHPIPENDRAWGTDFTDWVSVARARPLFSAHQQPQLPADLGFYDPRLPEARRRQAELARAHGVDGFVYHYYWFNGRKLLQAPIESMLASGEPDFPFCLSWANENWTRRWDGHDDEILQAQTHDLAGDCAFFREVLPFLRDRRYLTCDGKPVLVVYRPELMRDPAETAAAWRDEGERAGLAGLHLCAVRFGIQDPRPIGFDALIEFPPHHFAAPPWNGTPLDLPDDFAGSVLDYRAGIRGAPPERRFTRYPGVMPAWDNTARRGQRAKIFHGATPELYEEWLRQASMRACLDARSDDHFVFVNAWNEWAEGAHLEPDQRHGLGFLEATRRVSEWVAARTSISPRLEPARGRRPVLFVSHDAHQAGAQLLLLELVRSFARSGEIEPIAVLCGGGRLEPEFERAARTFNLGAGADLRGAIGKVLAALPELPAAAFCSTVVSSAAAEALDERGIPVVSMILELPTSIRALDPESVPRLVKHSRRTLVVSRFVRDRVAAGFGLDAARLEVIHLGLSRPIRPERRSTERARILKELGFPDDCFLVLGCGSVHPRKGTDLFVQVARACSELPGGARMRFAWVGEDQDGPAFGAWCRHDLEAAGLSGRVAIAGGRAETEPCFLAADAFALTSREDPFPLVNLEAMAAGLPVVAFEGAGGAAEALEGGAGVLVPYLDCDAMARELARLAADPAAAAGLGESARRRVDERFRWERYLADVRRVLREEMAP